VKKQMRIAVVAHTPANAYSGGRYHALMLAQCLAMRGHDSWYLTNNVPIFEDEICGAHSRRATVIQNLNGGKDGPTNLDVVVVAPHQTPGRRFYSDAERMADRTGARLAIINYESANWFNEVSP
jgi:hypothetical protein